ncbi:MAG TPA: C45 family peptidase [Mycobacteriales bacterium]|nr:C45 family peptidase [Mycobacteriales bacterium]
MVAARLTPVVVLAGPPTARGEAYGESARDLIQEAADRWTENIGRAAPVPITEYLTALVDGTGFRAAAWQHCPALLDELSATARSSGVEERTLFAMNLLDEEWWMRRRLVSGEAHAHCSGFGIPPRDGHPAYVGQNMDLPGWMDGLQILLDVRPPDGPAALVPSWPGMVALDGVNEHGVGVCVNTLAQLPTSATGVPVAFVIRMLLEQRHRTDAVALLHALPHASGQNYVIGDPAGVADIECSAAGAVEYAAETAWFAHTNHPLVDGHEGDIAPTDNGSQDRSVPRLTHLSRRLRDLEQVDPAQLGKVLTEPPLCRGSDGDPGFTLYSAIMELGTAPVLHLTAGPPSDHPLVAFEVSQS